MPEKFLSGAKEAAALMGVSVSTAYKLFNEGHLGGYRPPGLGQKRKAVRFSEAGIKAYIEKGRVRPPVELPPAPPARRRRPAKPSGPPVAFRFL